MRSAGWVLMCAVTVGCSPGAPGVDIDHPFEVLDSAGVEIRLSTAPAWNEDTMWKVAPEPLLSIGGIDTSEGHHIWRLVGAGRLSDGHIAVLAGGNDSARLLLFDRSGTLAGEIGRPGEGPGEFRDVEHLQVLTGDTLVVWERPIGTTTRFDANGQVLEEARPDYARFTSQLGGGFSEVPAAHLPDGGFVVSATRGSVDDPEAPSGPPFRPAVRYGLVPREGPAIWLGNYHGPEMWTDADDWSAIPASFAFPLFPRNSAVARSLSEDGHVYVSDGDGRDIDVYDFEGQLIAIIRRDVAPIPITDSDREAAIERFVTVNAVTPEGERRWREALAARPPELHHPSPTTLLVDRLGWLWALDAQHADGGGTWSVFASDGRWMGRVSVPLGRIHDAGSDYLLVVHRDSMGVESVHELALDRR